MKLIYLLCALPILTQAEPKLGEWKKSGRKSRASQDCKNIICPAVEHPVCVKLKYKNMPPTYVMMINKCELKYVKCFQNVDGVILKKKYCDHSSNITRSDDKKQTIIKRHKRSAKYEANNEGNKIPISTGVDSKLKTELSHTNATPAPRAGELRSSKSKHILRQKADDENSDGDQQNSDEEDSKENDEDTKGDVKNVSSGKESNKGILFKEPMFAEHIFEDTENMFDIRDPKHAQRLSSSKSKKLNDKGKKKNLYKGYMHETKMMEDEDNVPSLRHFKSIGNTKKAKRQKLSATKKEKIRPWPVSGKIGQMNTDDEHVKDFSAPQFASPEGNKGEAVALVGKFSNKQKPLPTGVQIEEPGNDGDVRLAGVQKGKEPGPDDEVDYKGEGIVLVGTPPTDLEDDDVRVEDDGGVEGDDGDDDGDDDDDDEGGSDTPQQLQNDLEEVKPEEDETLEAEETPETEVAEIPAPKEEEEEEEETEFENPPDPVEEEDDYNSQCPSRCPSRPVMSCGRCQHGVYRTFLSVCHLRMFNCRNADEKMELVSRYPCVAPAPYISSAKEMNLTPQGKVDYPNDHDKVLRFIQCRSKGMVMDPDMQDDLGKEFKQLCRRAKNELKFTADYSTYGY